MFCWPEVVAKRGSDEVQSCFLSDVPPSTTTLCVYSDGCRWQNKNSNVLHYLFTLVSKGRFQQIQHTFPVRGHSYLPNDCDLDGRSAASESTNVSIQLSNGCQLSSMPGSASHSKRLNVISLGLLQ